MMFKYDLDPKLNYHRQDDATNCGRACAQMVISWLQLAPRKGSGQSPPADNTPIVQQGDLEKRESRHNSHGWSTHPDELRDLLKKAHELTDGATRKWRVGNHGSLEGLLADVVLGLQNDLMPACLNVDSSDHWIVIVGAQLNQHGHLTFLKYFDPGPPPDRGQVTPSHTYLDGCGRKRCGCGYFAPQRKFSDHLVGWQVEVSGRYDTPTGLTDYAHRYVGIIYDGPRASNELPTLSKSISEGMRRIAPAPPPPPPMPPSPVPSSSPMPPSAASGQAASIPHVTAAAGGLPDPAALREEISRTAKEWGIDELSELEDLLGQDPVLTVRQVRGIDDSSPPYILASLYAKSRQSGLVAVFGSDGSLVQFQFVDDERIHSSLPVDEGKPLYWSSALAAPCSSPYYPFCREDKDRSRGTYVRLIDQYVAESVQKMV